MKQSCAHKVYEQIAATHGAAEGIRPGGIQLTKRALAWCQLPPGSRVLDVGCGTGFTLGYLSDVHRFVATGIDASSLLLDRGSARNPALQLVGARGEHLPVAGDYADGLLAECSLSVMTDPDRALGEFRRVLRTGGKLIVSDVYARNPDCADRLLQLPSTCCVRGAVTRERLVERIIDHGFSVDLWEDHSDLLTKFAVQLIFAYGSMNGFWLRTASDSVDPGEIQRAVSEVKPGYFLLIAHKVAGKIGCQERIRRNG
ncbi:MAG: methyltransferase domain-containing protein [Desulfomonile tiedjei]|nr:methyltransferase domain-containing protein [Desulfomonile tiedjei]